MSLLEIRNLNIKYGVDKGFLTATEDVNMTIEEGQIFGLVGESGCGKTTLGLSILRILPANAVIESGEIIVNGTDILKLSDNEMRKMRGKYISMIFQGAMNSLNPVINVERQVAETLLVHEDIKEAEALEKAREKLSLVGLSKNVGKMFPHELSGGMKQRVVIAMALMDDPQVLIADEPTTALDVVTQVMLLKLLKSICREFGLTMIMVSHDLSMVSEVADEVCIMYGGKTCEIGKKKDVLSNPSHPYTSALLGSIITPDTDKEITGIPGDILSLINPPPGCRFYDRCSSRNEECKTYEYAPYNLKEGHTVYCTLHGGK